MSRIQSDLFSRESLCGGSWFFKMFIVECSGGVVSLHVWFSKTCDGRHSLGHPTDILCLFSVSFHHVLFKKTVNTTLRWLKLQSCQIRCVGKLQYSIHTQLPDISRSFTIALLIHQNRVLYMLHGSLNHFCGSSSHSPQPPRVNVNCTIRKELGGSLQRLLALTSSQSSQHPQPSWAVATDLGTCEWLNVSVCQPICAVCFCAYVPHALLLSAFWLYDILIHKVFIYGLPAHP